MSIFSSILGLAGSFLGPIGGAVGSAVGGLMDADRAEEGVRDQNLANAAEAQRTREFNAAEAEKNRLFQREMSSSAFQRATRDMKYAGLNPMLAYSQGGASVPSGSSASGVAARFENAKAAGLERDLLIQRLTNETKVADSQAELNRANAVKAAAETEIVPVTGKQIEAHTRVFDETLREINARVENIRQDTHTSLARSNLLEAQRQVQLIEKAVKWGQIEIQEADKILKALEAQIMRYTIPRLANEADAQKSWWMRNVSPYLPDVLKSTGALGGIRGLTK